VKKGWSIGIVLLVLSWAWGATAQVRPSTPVPTKATVAPRATTPARQPPSNKITPAQNKIVKSKLSQPSVTPAKKSPTISKKQTKPVTKPTQIAAKEVPLEALFLSHWQPVRNEKILEVLGKMGVGKWVPAPRGMYPLRFVQDEIQQFEEKRGKIDSESKRKELQEKIKPYLARLKELKGKEVNDWAKRCGYEEVIEELLPTEVRNSENYKKLNLKKSYIFEDAMENFINVLAFHDGNVWSRSFAKLEEEPGKNTRDKNEKVMVFSAKQPFVDFSYVLRKSFESQKCLGGGEEK